MVGVGGDLGKKFIFGFLR